MVNKALNANAAKENDDLPVRMMHLPVGVDAGNLSCTAMGTPNRLALAVKRSNTTVASSWP